MISNRSPSLQVDFRRGKSPPPSSHPLGICQRIEEVAQTVLGTLACLFCCRREHIACCRASSITMGVLMIGGGIAMIYAGFLTRDDSLPSPVPRILYIMAGILIGVGVILTIIFCTLCTHKSLRVEPSSAAL